MKLDRKGNGGGNPAEPLWCPCSGTCGLTCANACFGCHGSCTGSCAGSMFLYPDSVGESEK